MESVNFETCVGDSEKEKHLLGVSKKGNKWRAKVWHPKRKTLIHLGYYSTPDEAADAVKKKKAEFEEMREDGFKERKLPSGVRRKGANVHKKKTEFQKKKVKSRCKGLDHVVEEPACVVLSKSYRVDGHNTSEEAVGAFDKDKVLLAAKREGVEHKARLDSEASNDPEESECELGHRCLIPSENLNSGVVSDNFDHEVELYAPHEQRTRCVYELCGYGSKRPNVAANKGWIKFRRMSPLKSGMEPRPKGFNVGDDSQHRAVGTSECLDEYGTGKVPAGVRKIKSGKWVARIADPESKARIWLGTYNTSDEAVQAFNEKKAMLASKRKRVESDEWIEFKNKTNFDFETVDDPEEPKHKFGSGCTENLNNWVEKDKLSCEVVADAPDKLQNWRVNCSPISLSEPSGTNGMDTREGVENVKFETHEGVSGIRKHFLGVSKVKKSKNRWQARVWHPVLKFHVYVGCYSSPEEAAAAVNIKKAEFQEMFKEDGYSRMEIINDDFVGRKLPCGVMRRGYCSWAAQIWHPKFRRSVYLGSYRSPEEAAAAVEKKRAEILKMCGCKKRVKPKCKGVGVNLEEPECGVLTTSKWLDECSFLKVPAGVRKIRTGRRVARVIDPESNARVLLGPYDTCEEAVRVLNKEKAVLAVKRKRDEFSERIKAIDDSEEPEFEFDYRCAENTNSSVVKNKLQNRCVYNSPTSILKPVVSSSGYVSDEREAREGIQKTTVYASGFDEAVSSGFMNEYGQLLGKYSILDEQMGLCLPDEDVAIS